ncbi:PEGA domain-containing protein [Halobaculum sp. WSA2]|uniref:PEGA domain-containing protein n=2 Tax=Halobaculum saliterrae TaxID=2073113 RepID=A0A6B0T2D9_9EURY|nr:PEGA domain-containing protein [Halobaculum saliterrae]
MADGAGGPSIVDRVSEALRPRLLGVRAAVPTAATLSVFVLIVLVVGGLVGTLAPLAGTGTGTITESGAAHPLNSRIDAAHARVLRAQGIAASPEIIAAQASNGQPYLVRGANYTAFADVSGADLVEGRPPDDPGEAVVGDGLARTLGVDVGDSITIGGSVSPAVDRVRIVGRYEAEGLVDDQLVVPLATVGDSATGGRDQVHLIRTEASAEDALAGDGGARLVVTEVETPDDAAAGEPAPVSLTVRNFGDEAGSRTVTVETDGRNVSRSVDLDGGEATTVDVNVTWTDPGTYPIVVGPFERSVRVTRPGALTLPAEFPRRAPPDSTLLVPVVTTNGTRLSEGQVRFGEFVAPTNAEGVATVPMPSEPGTYPVVVSAPGHGEFRTTVEVTPNATRELSARIQIEPESGTPVTRPNVSVVVANPWGATLERNLTLVMPTGVEERTVRLEPGNTSRVRVEPEAAGFDGEVDPGTYTFRLLSDGELVATERYEVVGGGGAVAGGLPPGSAAYASGTGIGTVITRVFGNVQVLFAGMVLLAGVATVSGTVAAFARAVQSRGRTVGIYRATGMSRRRVLAIVAGDALRLAVPAVAAAFALATVAAVIAEELDLLVAFGVRIELALLSPAVAVALVGSVGLAVASAAVASVPFLLAPPAALLRDGD